MAVSDEISRIKGNIASAYSSAGAKGATLPAVQNSANLAGCIDTITGGGGEPATKFGASVDTWIGDVDENGVLQKTTWKGALNFTGVKSVDAFGLNYAFYYCTGITSVDFSSLQSIGNSGLNYAFNACTGITSVDFSSLQSIGNSGLYFTCYGCTGITSVDFSSLQSIGNSGLQNAFGGCSKLTIISFPSLTDVQTNSFASSAYNAAFYNCPKLTEIHFRADMQATIEAMSQYANKFGATNASIIFDL